MQDPESHTSPDAHGISEATHFELWAAELAGGRRRIGRAVLRFLFEGAWLSGVVVIPDAHQCLTWFRDGRDAKPAAPA